MTDGRLRSDRQEQHGFTLLELLISITLLALLLGMLFAGLRFGNRAWEATTARLDQESDVRVVQAFLRRQLNRTLVLTESPAEGFRGSNNSVRFASALPEHFGLSGIYLLTVSADDGADGRALILRREPFTLGGVAPAETAGEGENILLRDIRAVDISYFGAPSPRDPPQWNQQWTGHEDLPSLVRIRVRFPDGDDRVWPELVVAPMINTTPEVF